MTGDAPQPAKRRPRKSASSQSEDCVDLTNDDADLDEPKLPPASAQNQAGGTEETRRLAAHKARHQPSLSSTRGTAGASGPVTRPPVSSAQANQQQLAAGPVADATQQKSAARMSATICQPETETAAAEAKKQPTLLRAKNNQPIARHLATPSQSKPGSSRAAEPAPAAVKAVTDTLGQTPSLKQLHAQEPAGKAEAKVTQPKRSMDAILGVPDSHGVQHFTQAALQDSQPQAISLALQQMAQHVIQTQHASQGSARSHTPAGTIAKLLNSVASIDL